MCKAFWVVLLACPAFLSPSRAAAQAAREAPTYTGTIRKVEVVARAVTFQRLWSYGISGRQDILDVIIAGRDCEILLDGKSVGLPALRPGHHVAIFCKGRDALATRITAVSEEALARARKEQHESAVRIRLLELELRNKYEREARERLEALRAARALAALDWAARQEAARQAMASNQAPMPLRELTTPARSTRPPRYAGDDTAVAAIAKILAAWGAEGFARGQDKKDGLLAALLSVGARVGRDKLIESAVRDVFPDLSDPAVRAIRRVVGLYLDGALTFETFSVETAKDEIKSALAREEPRLGNALEVIDFLYLLHQTRARRR